MKAETLKKRMFKHHLTFEKLWTKIVKDVNEYVETNPEKTFYSFEYSDIEKFIDSLCLSGAWIKDRIDGKSGLPHNKNYKGSLTKGIRKALGYTL